MLRIMNQHGYRGFRISSVDCRTETLECGYNITQTIISYADIKNSIQREEMPLNE